jgi:ATP-binding cassette, subfamily C, bacterial CydCD
LRLVDGRLDLLTGLVVLILAPEVYLPLRAVGARFHDSAEGLAAASEVFAVLETQPPAGADRVPAPNPARVAIRLEGVTVDGRAGRVLGAEPGGMNLLLEPGTALGVCGPSGSGKSTLVDLLLGLRTPDEGRVLVGGVDLADVDRDAWLRRIAWVPQRPTLVRGTVADNIRLGQPFATTESVAAAAEAAALDIPLDTPVGEDGNGLSTGQQRRVALARAVLADRPFPLLDEPTEGVDAETEAAIISALHRVVAGRTVVLVSHRPELLAVCDRLLTIDAVVPLASLDRRPVPQQASQPTPTPPAPPVPQASSGPTATRSSAGALRWSLTAARGQRGRLALAALLGALALGCGVALTATSAWLISAAALQPPVLALMVAIVAVRAFGLGKGVLRYAERLLSHDAALRAGAVLRERIWQALVRLGPAATARLRRGELLSRLVGDVDAQQDLLIRVAVPAASVAAVGVATAVGMTILLPVGGAVVAAGLVLAGVVAPAVTVWAAHRTERRTAAMRGDVLGRTLELLDAAPDLLAFNAADRYRARLEEADRTLSRLLRRAATARGLGGGVGVLAIGVMSVAATAAGIVAVRGRPTGPGARRAGAHPARARRRGRRIARRRGPPAHRTTRRSAAGRAREQAVPRHGARPPGPRRPAGGPCHQKPRRALARRRPRRRPRRGHDAAQRHAARDHRAVGLRQSSVVAALMRSLDPAGGAVLADGRDVRYLAPDTVRDGIAWCGAATHLFDNTLRANLLLASPAATDDELVVALERAQLGGWLATLPNGLDTALGEHGGAVSGGERQRIGVARALLADRPVTILDEPTAHLDARTADALAEELLDVTRGRTALIVTHRPEQTPGLPRAGPRPS